MTATTTRRAILVDSKEVTFTPYVIRKVGELRKIKLDGAKVDVIYNERRNLSYLVLDIDGTPTTGRIVAELKDGFSYETCKKATRVAPPVGKKAQAPVPTPEAKEEAAPAAKKARKPKVEEAIAA